MDVTARIQLTDKNNLRAYATVMLWESGQAVLLIQQLKVYCFPNGDINVSYPMTEKTRRPEVVFKDKRLEKKVQETVVDAYRAAVQGILP